MIGAQVDFDVLGDGRLERGAVAALLGAHPGLDGGRRDAAGTVGNGRLEGGYQLGDDGILIGRIHRIDPTDHQDEVHFEVERLEAGDEFVNFRRIRAGEERDLHAAQFHRRDGAEFLHSGDHPDHARGIARILAVGVGDQAADKAEVGRHHAEPDVR